MKIILNVPKSKLLQVMALVSLSDTEIPDAEVEEIVNTPEVDITEYCNEGEAKKMQIAMAAIAVAYLMGQREK